MSPTQKAPTKAAGAKASTARDIQARWRENERVIRRVTDSLEVAQADLIKLRGSLGAGIGDAHKNLLRLLRDAAKLSKATRRDLERLQKDMLAAAKAAPKRASARKPASSAKAATKRTAAKAASKRAGAKAASKSKGAKAAPKRAGAKAATKRAAGAGKPAARRAGGGR